MKLLHAVPKVDQEAAGPSYSVPALCQALSARGHEVSLATIAARNRIPGVSLELYSEWPILRRFEVSTSLARAMRRKANEVDIVHNHSLWSMVNVASGLVVPGKRAKLVTSPRGTLSPWALSRTRHLKRVLRPFQWRALERADLLHATSEVELGEIRAQGFRAPVAVIPNGIDVPLPVTIKTSEETRTLLFLSRIHPTKGLDRLLHAWRTLQGDHPEWRLVIAGRGETDYVGELTELARSLRLERVSFPGPLYGDAKAEAYRRADLFVLPTHSENFGMVVAEALAHACPVVVSRGAPWAGVESEHCGWWVLNDVEVLARALDTAMRLPQGTLVEMGVRGREWMSRAYSWDSVAAKMEAAYDWVMSDGGTSPPPHVSMEWQ
jgi:glycosyltransferase involved in cell wall biosynthesis